MLPSPGRHGRPLQVVACVGHSGRGARPAFSRRWRSCASAAVAFSISAFFARVHPTEPSSSTIWCRFRAWQLPRWRARRTRPRIRRSAHGNKFGENQGTLSHLLKPQPRPERRVLLSSVYQAVPRVWIHHGCRVSRVVVVRTQTVRHRHTNLSPLRPPAPRCRRRPRPPLPRVRAPPHACSPFPPASPPQTNTN